MDKQELITKSAVQGMILAVAASAAISDAEGIENGKVRMYSKEELVFALKGAGRFMDKAAETILALLDELNPEVARKNAQIAELNRLLDL